MEYELGRGFWVVVGVGVGVGEGGYWGGRGYKEGCLSFLGEWKFFWKNCEYV